MKKIYKVGIIALMSLVGFSASAQQSPVQFGIEAGANLSNASWDVSPLESNPRVGFQLGVTAEYGINESFYLQSGLSFTTKGAVADGMGNVGGDVSFDGKITVNQSYLQLPVYAAYKIDVTPGTRIVFNAGPYIAYGIAGKTNINGYVSIPGDIANGDRDIETFGDDGILNRFDFGLGAGVGAEFGKFVVSLRYELGLKNVAKEDDYKNRNASLTLGYKF